MNENELNWHKKEDWEEILNQFAGEYYCPELYYDDTIIKEKQSKEDKIAFLDKLCNTLDQCHSCGVWSWYELEDRLCDICREDDGTVCFHIMEIEIETEGE